MMEYKPPEVRLNDDGTLDEIVGDGLFHLEQMDNDEWWLCFEQAGKRVDVWLRSQKPITAVYEEDESTYRPAAPVIEPVAQQIRDAALEDAARKARSFLVGDPANGVPLRSPMAHEIADAIREMKAAPASPPAVIEQEPQTILAVHTKLMMIAANTSSKEYAGYAQEMADEILEMAPTYAAKWKEGHQMYQEGYKDGKTAAAPAPWEPTHRDAGTGQLYRFERHWMSKTTKGYTVWVDYSTSDSMSQKQWDSRMTEVVKAAKVDAPND